MRGKLLCSGVGITVINTECNPRILTYLQPNVEELSSLQCKQRKRARYGSHFGIGTFRSVVTDKCCILYVIVVNVLTVRVKYVPTEQFFK